MQKKTVKHVDCNVVFSYYRINCLLEKFTSLRCLGEIVQGVVV